MNQYLRLSIFGLALAAACAPLAKAGVRECREELDRYNNALSDVSDALRRYARCLSDSQGNDDCSSEFRRVRSAQNDFEAAVSAYRLECQ